MTRSWAGGPYLVLALGVAVVSTASILIRYAQAEGVPSLTIAALRLGLAALVLTPIVWTRAAPELHALRRRDLALALCSGVALAIHFWSWIASLAYTSVASSTVLVTTNPLWVGLASMLILGERPGRGTIGGIALTFAGSLFIFTSDSAKGGGAALQPDPVFGNLLALLGALAASAYLLLGRALRPRVGLLVYIWLAYGTAALVLLVTVGVTGHALAGYSTLAYAVMIALAIGPQLLGHTTFNWALRHVSATFVAISILGEPIGSALLALLLFGERFAPLQLAGFLLILGGIFLAARGEGESEAKRRERVFSEEQSDVRAQDHSHGDDPATGHDPRVP
jgi:drug/metabolite transporter (DMT)-like permease